MANIEVDCRRGHRSRKEGPGRSPDGDQRQRAASSAAQSAHAPPLPDRSPPISSAGVRFRKSKNAFSQVGSHPFPAMYPQQTIQPALKRLFLKPASRPCHPVMIPAVYAQPDQQPHAHVVEGHAPSVIAALSAAPAPVPKNTASAAASPAVSRCHAAIQDYSSCLSFLRLCGLLPRFSFCGLCSPVSMMRFHFAVCAAPSL